MQHRLSRFEREACDDYWRIQWDRKRSGHRCGKKRCKCLALSQVMILDISIKVGAKTCPPSWPSPLCGLWWLLEVAQTVVAWQTLSKIGNGSFLTVRLGKRTLIKFHFLNDRVKGCGHQNWYSTMPHVNEEKKINNWSLPSICSGTLKNYPTLPTKFERKRTVAMTNESSCSRWASTCHPTSRPWTKLSRRPFQKWVQFTCLSIVQVWNRKKY